LIPPKGKKVLERTLGPKREEVAEEWNKERNDDIHSDIQSSTTY